MALSNFDNEMQGTEKEMSAAVASNYVRRMVQREMRSAGDTEGALARIEQKYGIGFWQLSHLKAVM